ncbi:MAG: hypothetical protein UZ11_BCD004001276, partial [Bacteroidetes bacterium OLB11]
ANDSNKKFAIAFYNLENFMTPLMTPTQTMMSLRQMVPMPTPPRFSKKK